MANLAQSILRGKRYHSRRDLESGEMPKWEQSQPAIMADITNYLSSIKPVAKPKEEKPKEK